MDLIKYLRSREFPSKYERSKLAPAQLEFLRNVIPFGIVWQEQTYSKCKNRKKTPDGIFCSTIVADLIVRSNWGSLEPARDEKQCNLGMLKKEDAPKVKCEAKKWKVDGELYRKYGNWYDFGVDMTDHYVFSGFYDEVLAGRNSDEQIDALNKVYTLRDLTIHDNIENIIADYGLIEFDSHF